MNTTNDGKHLAQADDRSHTSKPRQYPDSLEDILDFDSAENDIDGPVSGLRTAVKLSRQSEFHETRNELNQAEALQWKVLAIRETILGPDEPSVLATLSKLAHLCVAQGKNSEAEQAFALVLTIKESALGCFSPALAEDLDNMAAVHDVQGNYTKAQKLYERALRIREQSLGKHHPDLIRNICNLAITALAQQRPACAEKLYRRALSAIEQSLGPEHPAVVDLLEHLAGVVRQTPGSTLETHDIERPGSMFDSLCEMAIFYHRQGLYLEAGHLYRRAIALHSDPAAGNSSSLLPEHSDVLRSLAKRLSTKEMAERTNTSVESIRHQLFRLLAELGMMSTSKARRIVQNQFTQ